MINRNPVIQPKFLEEPLLQPGLLPHHPPGPPTDFNGCSTPKDRALQGGSAWRRASAVRRLRPFTKRRLRLQTVALGHALGNGYIG
jgi:hypothetical protein